MIQNLGPFRPRIQGPENIGPNDVKFDPFFDQKVACKLRADQGVQNLDPFKFSTSGSAQRRIVDDIEATRQVGPNSIQNFNPFWFRIEDNVFKALIRIVHYDSSI
jgi:hypothetical protein